MPGIPISVLPELNLISTGCSGSILPIQHIHGAASAADIVANLQSPYVGEVINIAVAADGTNSVNLIAGTNVTVKTTVSVVQGTQQ